MKMKMKKKSKYIRKNKEFATFKAMKTYTYYNMRTGEKIKGYELTIDEILKEYELIKQERRLLCTETYNAIEEYKKLIEEQQLNLFNT